MDGSVAMTMSPFTNYITSGSRTEKTERAWRCANWKASWLHHEQQQNRCCMILWFCCQGLSTKYRIAKLKIIDYIYIYVYIHIQWQTDITEVSRANGLRITRCQNSLPEWNPCTVRSHHLTPFCDQWTANKTNAWSNILRSVSCGKSESKSRISREWWGFERLLVA